jgi:eukaryotic-like serine/threonine-protein kinase
MEVAPTLGDGRYIIGRELGRGSMGVVYEAEDTVLGRTVAVKTIELAFAAGEEVRKEFEQRFFTEARVAARLSHPGIVVCHDVGKDPASGKLFIVFEYLKGRTLADHVAEGPMAWRDALDVVVKAARAIHHAHEHGVVHRDLKPANIMLLDARAGTASARGKTAVKIMDFGVARLESLGPGLTGPGQSFGSPLYTSPEQALGEKSSARSDIFSLGSVLCTLLLGRPWFAAPSIPEIVARVAHADPPRVSSLRPEVPGPLDAVVAAALAKREGDRYATAADMADDLEDVLAGGTPRHARAVPPSSADARASAEDPLLDGLIAPPAGGLGRALAPDASAPLGSLLDEATATLPGRQRRPAAAAAGSARRWLLAAGALVAVPLLVAAAFLAWPRPAPLEPAPRPSAPVSANETSPTVSPAALPGPDASPAAAPVPPATVETQPARPAPRASASAPVPAPTARPTPRAPTAAISPPATDVSVAAEVAPVPSPDTAGRTRMRLNVEHPFENGRLIVWIDGVLAVEAKLQAPVSKKIVAIKVREGRLGTVIDVEPGRHEVRVEVTWDQERRVATKVADVALGSTGLLDVRVGRISKDLTLQWSRLTKD